MKDLPVLVKGDRVGIIAPAKAIDPEIVVAARQKLEGFGYVVELAEHCTGRHHYFSGTESERAVDFQRMLDDPSIKAIFCARGGYGAIQIVDVINWASFLRSPKWIVGFSDITVFHQHINKLGFESVHGTMPLNFEKNSDAAFSTLLSALSGKRYSIECPSHKENKPGEASGKLLGGNLSILHCLLGTDDQPDYTGSILFIEDLAEQLYYIDRIFHSLRKAGILEKINGLIVGGMTDLKDTEIPFGMNYKEVILSHFRYRKIPICFDFPAGHIDDNRALVLGRSVTLSVSNERIRLDL